MARGFESVDGGVAAHEADHGALDGGIEAEVVDDVEVEAGRVEAGAGGDDDVGDAAALVCGEGEIIQGVLCELRSEALEKFHAARGRREVSGNVDLLRVAPRTVRSRDRVNKGIAVLDCGEARHAAKEIAEGSLIEQIGGEVDEGAMHIMLRDGCRDAVDVCGRHSVPFVPMRMVPKTFSNRPRRALSFNCNYLMSQITERANRAVFAAPLAHLCVLWPGG